MSRSGIEKLASIAGQPERLILGLMSGTSLDGLDLALCQISGSGFNTTLSVKSFTTVPFTDGFRNSILEVFSGDQVNLQSLTLLNAEIARHHAAIILDTLREWAIRLDDIDLIASHGQTVFHAPRSLHGQNTRPNATLQLGDGDHLARLTGIITLSDFRQKHIAGGGEGAPLAAYGDLLLLSDPSQARVLLNIGGIANFTYLPALNDDAAAFSTDIGPGNTLMDAFVRRFFPPFTFDQDAERARQGSAHRLLLSELMKEQFLRLPHPRTTGPELFSLDWFLAARETFAPDLSKVDSLATLNRFSAEAIAASVASLPGTPDIYVSGGGARNPLLLAHVKELLPHHRVGSTEQLGIDPDAKEAILFAILANEALAGSAGTFRGRLMGAPAITMGKISLPD